MKTKKQAARPKPDVKSATKEMLRLTAEWMECMAGTVQLFGQARRTKEEQAVLQEARALAAAYVRKGAEG